MESRIPETEDRAEVSPCSPPGGRFILNEDGARTLCAVFGLRDSVFGSQYFSLFALRTDVADPRRLDEDEDFAAAAMADPVDPGPLVLLEILRLAIELAHPFDLRVE